MFCSLDEIRMYLHYLCGICNLKNMEVLFQIKRRLLTCTVTTPGSMLKGTLMGDIKWLDRFCICVGVYHHFLHANKQMSCLEICC